MVHCFDTDIAKEYGILEAVIINHFVFWLSKNRANQVNFHDGDYWTYNSTAAFQELFPYASKRQIERALQHLRDEDIIKTGNYNEVKYDRTLWYAFTEKGKCISRFGEMDITEKGNGNHQTVTPIPDNNSYNNTDTDTDNITRAKPTRHKYGEYSNVLLSDEDMEKLKAEFPSDWKERIERLSEYMASTGKSYKNHLATIRNWARKDSPKQESKPVDGVDTHKIGTWL